MAFTLLFLLVLLASYCVNAEEELLLGFPSRSESNATSSDGGLGKRGVLGEMSSPANPFWALGKRQKCVGTST
jgi:hypothetical protein